MGLAITEEHQELATVVREFATEQRVRAAARAALDPDAPSVPDVWKRIADLGWLGLHLPESAGGSGFGVPELAIVVDELGHAVGPGRLLPSVTASAVLAGSGGEALRELVTRLADGSAVAGLGLAPGLTREAGGVLTGELTVLAGQWADVFVLAAGDDLLVVPAGAGALAVAPVTGLDPSLGLVKATVTGLAPADGHVLAGAAGAAVSLLRTLAAAEAAGGARGCLDFALEYASVREQFGRPIGSFQAVKHHLATMLVGVELATALAWDAVRGAATADEAGLAAAAAAGFALRNYQDCARKAIQIFGGIGFTWEHDAHLYLRRAGALQAMVAALGSPEDEVFAATKAGVRRQFTIDLPEEAQVHRAEARRFLARYRATPDGERRALLASSGYQVPHWPEPFGRGASAVEQLVLEEELSEVETPSLGIGGWVLLTLAQTANEEQIQRWIAPGLLGEQRWCQLFSEPNAGSDAAAVQTRGRRVDGGWRVSGQKVWTSDAQNCNRGLATVRTDPEAPKHKGITAMAVDLTAPGVTIRPLREITGQALFNEVFFDDVFVPDEDVVGEPNDGWRVARATLGNERVSIGGGSREGLSAWDLPGIARRYGVTDTEHTRAIARLVTEEQAMRALNLRQATRAVAGAGAGPEGNVTKLLSSEHAQRVTELAVELSGTAAVTGDEEAIMFEYLFGRCLSIAGGTSEITRNVIAERILGLPRDPLAR
ncbi:acyl-CoA dehydrogenase [Actinomadura madurae]|uniref:acyl-CoA dehydrogenase n=2 Tax=Actinomadura madurae TaxID=1993 RepID=UPI0020D22220|nr:acyl-CoA dehydrogenase [Actinomadura madurae]MCP9965034.1 acyl-CoA dehydrogenase [Actinomadura madurae]